MRVNIYKLRRQAADWVIDEKHPVAVVTVKDGQGSFHFYDKSWEKYLRELFTEPASAFRGGGKTPDGAYFDAFVTYPAWTREAIELIVSDKLRGCTLGGKIIEDEANATKSSERGQKLMRAKSAATLLLLGVAILSLPLCLVPIILWGGAAVPWMVADFTVANHSGETVYITPVTVSPVAVLQQYSIGQLRALRQADIRLPAGKSIRIAYDAESGRPGAIAVRNEAGEYRQLALNRGVRTYLSEPEIIYTLGSFDTLLPIDQWVLHAVQQATPFNFDFKYWDSMLIGTIAGGIPVGLFGVWFRRVRRQREDHNPR